MRSANKCFLYFRSRYSAMSTGQPHRDHKIPNFKARPALSIHKRGRVILGPLTLNHLGATNWPDRAAIPVLTPKASMFLASSAD